MSLLRLLLASFTLSALMSQAAPAGARQARAAAAPAPSAAELEEALLLESKVLTAPVVIDGRELFSVRGVSAFPAKERAATIEQRIRDLADDPDFDPSRLVTEDVPVGTRIKSDDDRLVMGVLDADGQLEGVSRAEMTAAFMERIKSAIVEYRQARTPEALWAASLHTLLALLALVAATWALRWLDRVLEARLRRRYQDRREGLGIQSFEIVRAERIGNALRAVMRTVRWLATVLLVIVFLRFALGRFPWTRGAAEDVGSWVLNPLATMGRSLLAEIPDLIFLGILYVIVRWVLRLLLLFFQAVEAGRVKLESFEPEWALPTYRLVRVAVIAFALVVAYPYIPGSHSDAFKGVSLFLGVLFSLGSSSAISNIIAGYMLTYRRAFRVGDRVQIGDVTGDVTNIRLQVTHLRTPKNEEVTIPNSSILAHHVLNYSALAQEDGVILHLSVGIGYETPWRQVEAMLLMAADRTEGLKKAPGPFVLQRGLGDFAVTYELNAYCAEPRRMNGILTEMSRNIQDAFNEYGVQIMTPNYVADPAHAKVVPREHWHAAPAKPDDDAGPDAKPARAGGSRAH